MQTQTLSFLADTACRGYVNENTAIWNLTVPICQIPKGLPFGPNARNAALKSKPAKAMLKTLAEEPENFVLYNGGIMVVAEEIKASRQVGGNFQVRLKLRVPTTEDEGDFLGHGVLNGGHTYKSLIYALYGHHKRGEAYPNLSKGHVQISIAVGINEDEIANISRARNLSLSVPLYALKNLAQDWKPIEDSLPKEYRQNVLFKPNEDGEFEGKAGYDVTDLIRRLALLNNNLFDFRQDKHPSSVYSSPGKLIQSWNEQDYKEVIPLLKDILWLEQKIIEQHIEINGNEATGKKVVISKISGCSKKPKKLITGAHIPLTVGEIFYMPVLAAFRVFIRDGQWSKPVEDLWKEWGPKLVDKIWDTYKNEGRSSAASFARSKSTWSTLTNLVAMQFVQI